MIIQNQQMLRQNLRIEEKGILRERENSGNLQCKVTYLKLYQLMQWGVVRRPVVSNLQN